MLRNKYLALVLIAAGIVLVVLGLESKFAFAGCPPGAISCLTNHSLDFLAIFIGIVTMSLGINMLRKLGRSG